MESINPPRKATENRSRLLIEAGERGWESLEFEELLQSSCEALGQENVHKLALGRKRDFLLTALVILKNRYSHVLIDPRTNPWPRFQVLRILLIKWIANFRGTEIIAYVTDLGLRSHRKLAFRAVGKKGVVATFIDPDALPLEGVPARISGPLPLSISARTYERLIHIQRSTNEPRRILFLGSLYSPRNDILTEISEGLREDARCELLIVDKHKSKRKFTSLEYWELLCGADVILNTTVQSMETELDWRDVPQMNYRFIEALATGNLLISQSAPGVEKFFKPEEEFLPFTSAQSAVKQVTWALDNWDSASEIANRGQRRASEHIYRFAFWRELNQFLSSPLRLRSICPRRGNEPQASPRIS